jgi:ribosomal protein S18 acetylase RimI-like enzyme
MQSEVREIRDGDIEPVVALWTAAGITRPWNDPYRDIAFARTGDHSTILVAVADDQVVATVMVGEDGHRGWAYYVAADPIHHAQGLGRTIMAAAEQWLIARGVWKIQLLVRGDNKQVVSFYEHLGYHDTGTVCMQKVLQG